MWYIFYQSWDSWGFASCLVSTESLMRSGKELLSGSHGTGWLMQVCLGSSQQGLEAGVEEGPQDRCADVLAGAHPLNCKGLLREKGKRGAGDTGTRESPLILGSVSRTARLRHRGPGEQAQSKDSPGHCHCFSIHSASSCWARSSLGVCM